MRDVFCNEKVHRHQVESRTGLNDAGLVGQSEFQAKASMSAEGALEGSGGELWRRYWIMPTPEAEPW